jgi:hypothetical protein
MEELSAILPEAAKEYNFDSLQSMFLGRLVYNGDIAVEVTKQYKEKLGANEKITTADYKTIAQFLASSTLAADFNQLFKPYGITVSGVSIEKVFFTTKKELYRVCTIETDSLSVPDKILDCITWIQLKRK